MCCRAADGRFQGIMLDAAVGQERSVDAPSNFTSCDHAEWPVFGEQFDTYAALSRPIPAIPFRAQNQPFGAGSSLNLPILIDETILTLAAVSATLSCIEISEANQRPLAPRASI